MTFIFDLDQTIVDSSIALSMRQNRNWQQVYKLIEEFKLFCDFDHTIKLLREKGNKVGIVTSSPSIYCHKVLNHFNIPVDFAVCYHDTKNHKPHPEPFLKALEISNSSAEGSLTIGDEDKDIVASVRADIPAIGCTWGKTAPFSVDPQHLVHNKREFQEVIQSYIGNF